MQKQSQVHCAVKILKHSNSNLQKSKVKQTVQEVNETGIIYLFSNIKSGIIACVLICCLWIPLTKYAAGPVNLFDYVRNYVMAAKLNPSLKRLKKYIVI